MDASFVEGEGEATGVPTTWGEVGGPLRTCWRGLGVNKII
jgi:hypothetical protein